MKICFLLSHVPNPRMNKRIAVAREAGEVHVICTRRVSQNIWEPYYKNIRHDIFDIDLPPASKPLKRMVMSRKFYSAAMGVLKEESPQLIYTEGLDSLTIAVDYKKKYNDCRIFYEVADLRECYITPPKSMQEKLLRLIIETQEKRLYRYVERLIVTSEKFYEIHYYKYFLNDQVLFIPNAPDVKYFKNYHKKTEGPFTVGFIGGIRYLEQMKMLADTSQKVGCNVLFAGAGGTDSDYQEIKDYCKGKENIIFTGKYNYEQDIARLYSMVDCVYAVYNADNPNVRIALPNKLYEAVLCELPIIVADNTYLSEIVNSWGVGISIPHNDYNALEYAIEKLKQQTFREEKAINCINVKEKVNVELHGSKLLHYFKRQLKI